MNDTFVSIGAAVVAGGFLAATGVLQQRAARRRPEREALSFRLLLSLAHRRDWLLGLATGAASYGFQALALAYGPLALVQPIFLSELLFAVPISVRLHRMRLHPREWAGVLSVAGGLGIGVYSAWPRPGDPLQPITRWAIAIGLVTAVSGLAVLVGRRIEGTARASLFAFAAAAVMALQSALLGATVALMKQGFVPLFTTWQPYALIPATAVGVMLVQSAYQAGPLAASMPVIDSAEPSIAIAIGVALFDEQIRHGVANLAGTAIGLTAFFVGIVLLDTSRVIHRLQRQESREQEQTEQAEAVSR